MKTTKKLSKVILAVAMCLMLVVTAWATDQIFVEYTAELADSQLCVNELNEQTTVQLKINTDDSISMDAFTAQLTLPEGWEINSIINEDSDDGIFDFYIENGMILWYSDIDSAIDEDMDIQVHSLATITIEVPADTEAGNYEIKFDLIDISRDFGLNLFEDNTSCTATVTVGEHTDGDDQDHLCDGGCGEQADEGHYGGTADCQNQAVCEECKNPYGDVDKTNHIGTDVTYVDDGDTHSATYDCCGEAYVTGEAHDFTNGDCVCGKKKPSDPVEGLKGDVNLDGDVTAEDALVMLKHALQAEIITNPEALANGEVTNDGELTAEDALKILQYALKAIDSWD